MVVIVTGPESSGKSTLCEALNQEYNSILVNEYAREFLKSSDYSFEDLEQIARTQLKNIAKAKDKAEKSQMVLADTGHIVLEIWFEERFGDLPKNWQQNIQGSCADLYLLCASDIPWEEDPLRENPHDRHRLFDLYKAKLEAHQLNYSIVQGNQDTRLVEAMKIIDKKKAAL